MADALVLPLLVLDDPLKRFLVSEGRRRRVRSIASVRKGCVNQQSAAPLAHPGHRYVRSQHVVRVQLPEHREVPVCGVNPRWQSEEPQLFAKHVMLLQEECPLVLHERRECPEEEGIVGGSLVVFVEDVEVLHLCLGQDDVSESTF